MKDDKYHLVTVKDGKSDLSTIINIFSQMSEGQLDCDLQLLNYYEEIPISYGATITTVGEDSIEVSVHQNQVMLIKNDHNTIIKSEHFHNQLGVHCYVAYVNVPKKTVILHNFAYAQIRAERREAVRVKVRGEIPVTFSFDTTTIKGRIVDISGNGISMLADPHPAFETNQTGLLAFTLNKMPLTVPGSFVRFVSSEQDRTIDLFRMEPDRRSEGPIGQFIYQRQIEIIRELKDGLIVD
jgi:hypothetical protein